MAMPQNGVKQAHSLGGPAESSQGAPTAKPSLHRHCPTLATARE
jgi:hypothetical protein